MHTAASCFTPFGCHKYTFWCKLTQIRRLHNTVLVFFYPIQIRIVGGSHYCGVNVHHVGVTLTLNWCSHSCKDLHFFGVTITLSLFLCTGQPLHYSRIRSFKIPTIPLPITTSLHNKTTLNIISTQFCILLSHQNAHQNKIYSLNTTTDFCVASAKLRLLPCGTNIFAGV